MCSTQVGGGIYPGPGNSQEFQPAFGCGNAPATWAFRLASTLVTQTFCWVQSPADAGVTFDCSTMTGTGTVFIQNPGVAGIGATPANCCGLAGPFTTSYAVHITPG
jgi:hypothetical protein